MTHYDVLGVPPDATFEQIKAAYREQIKFFHPDVFRGNPEVAKIKTLQLNEAYSVLRDPESRAKYDFDLYVYFLNEERASQSTKEPQQPSPPPRSAPPQSKKEKSFPHFRVAAAVLAVLAIFFYFHKPILPPAESSSASSLGSTQSSPPVLTAPKNGEVLYFDAASGERVAPLTIETTGDGYYYVKLKRGTSSRDVISFFVHGGQTVSLDVPLGDYDLVYAHGDTWYGKTELFGEDTVYCKADDSFLFYESDGYVNGWTVELYLQQNGNLGLEHISSDDF